MQNDSFYSLWQICLRTFHTNRYQALNISKYHLINISPLMCAALKVSVLDGAGIVLRVLQ